MQTHFSLAQLADPGIAESETILRKCVHCGFCTATCPTFVLLGDELDSPRGRIYLIKQMLENDRPADVETVTHVDRCLSCLSCMTTCPSGVNYMHLVDEARIRIEKTYARPLPDRALRALLGFILPYPFRFRIALRGAALAAPLKPILSRFGQLGDRMGAMIALAPLRLPPRSTFPDAGEIKPAGRRLARVALLGGCAQKVLRPGINDATIRLLTRVGVEVVLPKNEGCCGALVHHLGQEEHALAEARHNVDVWTAEIERGGLDAIIITASGCGTVIKDYGFLLRNDPAYAAKAAKVSSITKDVTEFLGTLKLPEPVNRPGLTLAYHSACSMQHGQKITTLPKQLLTAAGFKVRDVPEGHLCCGSAGTYNILQPEIAAQLRDRKIANILTTEPDAVATGNIGCITQIGRGLGLPVLHTVELLDYAYGGPKPAGLASLG
ncbi:glycolate oxidase iron-sulfur subunit [Methylocella tundrae]|uniref:Glycolate oxidase iron-sulfur subunit n=1 Tax=Methylocella tundrae TaxID=227605 RepID=A0A4U8Z391_METTU|nr:glycolate oxidase subunit GlcF [Methylocella tundrae]WPP03755.1 glycolate oxidase subunit GlcF [Methylocella tundrae]VFU09912.1 glycolate oxidase iron-sulfur subunit [Methylocella tundrae]VTZ25797.1 glycolate oxidase iron-sulfur subunit [Methylocella tundrae]VTZ52586.1 glycolate oxidase iron-sulfur subunit [Methylocella tundrae]